jgi:hypothetical protein
VTAVLHLYKRPDIDLSGLFSEQLSHIIRTVPDDQELTADGPEDAHKIRGKNHIITNNA